MLQLNPRLLAVGALLLTSCGKPLTADECSQLLDHYTVLLAKSRGDIRPEQMEEVVARARRHAAQDPEFSKCTAKVSRRQYDCAIKAPTVDDVEKCLL